MFFSITRTIFLTVGQNNFGNKSLNHLLLRLISTLLKLEISKQTNTKADDSNFNLETSKMAVEIFINVDKSKFSAYQTFADNRGDEISISKLMMFDNVGLVLMENGEFQCLACSATLSFDNDTASVAHVSPLDQYDHKSNIKLEKIGRNSQIY